MRDLVSYKTKPMNLIRLYVLTNISVTHTRRPLVVRLGCLCCFAICIINAVFVLKGTIAILGLD